MQRYIPTNLFWSCLGAADVAEAAAAAAAAGINASADAATEAVGSDDFQTPEWKCRHSAPPSLLERRSDRDDEVD